MTKKGVCPWKVVYICYTEGLLNFNKIEDFYKYMQLSRRMIEVEEKIKDFPVTRYLYYNNDGIYFSGRITDTKDCLHIFVNFDKVLVNWIPPKNLKKATEKPTFEVLK